VSVPPVTIASSTTLRVPFVGPRQQRVVHILGPDARVEIELLDDEFGHAEVFAISSMASRDVVAATLGSNNERPK
jgi:hypothetical protein